MSIENNLIPPSPQIDPQSLRPFTKFCCTIGNLPSSYLASMTYEEQLLWLCNYLENTVIPTINNNSEALQEVQNLFVELKNYVDNYFTNLDVQEEINNKLDSLVQDGTLTRLIGNYVTPYINEQNENIDIIDNKVEIEKNSRIAGDNNLQTQINSLASGSPLSASSTSEMTDTSKVYVNTTNGYWYYYNGTNWVQGGVYQSTVDSDQVEIIDNKIQSITSTDNNIFNPFTAKENTEVRYSGEEFESSTKWCTDFIPIDITKPIKLSVTSERIFEYDENKNILANQNGSTYYNSFNENTKFIKCNFLNETVSFDNRIDVKLINYNNFNNRYNESYYVIQNENIKNDTISLMKLEPVIRNRIIENCIKNNILPFTNKDFMYSSINATTGAIYGTSQKNICFTEPVKFKAGTTFVSEYPMRLFFYDENNTFIDKTSNNIHRYIITSDYYVKIQLTKSDNTNITDDDIISILNGLSISYNENEFSYIGEKININKNIGRWRYSNISDSLSQDAALYGDEMFSFDFSAYHIFNVINLKTGVTYGSFNLPADNNNVYPNCNTACFGNIKYNDNDEYPLLYVSYWLQDHFNQCAVYRITKTENAYTATYLYTITMSLGSCTFAIDTDNNFLYAISSQENYNRIYKFNVPTQETTLTENDVLDYFDVTKNNNHQGLQYYQGKLYQGCGNENTSPNSSYIYVIDLTLKKEVSRIYMGAFVAEPQRIVFYNNELNMGTRILTFE